jgi:hypothetical protein
MAKLDISKLAERLAQLSKGNSGGGSSMGFITINDGRNVVRLLPKRDNDETSLFGEQEVFVHYGVGKSETNKNGTMVVCPTTYGDDKACPVCELAAELRKLSKKKDDSYDKQARQVQRKKRVYYNAVSRAEDLNSYKYDEGQKKWFNKDGEEESPIKVLGTGVGVYRDILGIICDPEYGDITDFEEGLDVIITKSGTGFNTEYDVKTVRKESLAIPDDAPAELKSGWKEALHDLSSLAKVKTYSEIASIMDGSDPEPEPEPDVDAGTDNLPPKQTADTPDSGDDDALQKEIQAALARKRK